MPLRRSLSKSVPQRQNRERAAGAEMLGPEVGQVNEGVEVGFVPKGQLT
jgi:hypothetical protein